MSIIHAVCRVNDQCVEVLNVRISKSAQILSDPRKQVQYWYWFLEGERERQRERNIRNVGIDIFTLSKCNTSDDFKVIQNSIHKSDVLTFSWQSSLYMNMRKTHPFLFSFLFFKFKRKNFFLYYPALLIHRSVVMFTIFHRTKKAVRPFFRSVLGFTQESTF